ncbi:CD3324 family protein [Paenibacillus apiarius]|uniref:CD3324 family protein n=1 Tax=Paenibacillus apiarius TaxID=46240 RepID=A0ABT4E1E4_9BACL|nr:CD3324 family protein [Paenibacillus apiarius]MCY9514110.1 CD3324 family protein [Paenibacillus apiarius]MCY9523433.1 CD3324 family protein [Paenibacillus apiarius]MCY9555546.1 CD3324 family protein [Paenibacillus apiarius]MCY9561574.1 CD3324 family protein [Paenibacillus apiarius]MCY9687194.1 CD3324 family protein [Paenibacillus apiarius]
MKYVNADHVLPEALLREIQKYIQGGLVYVPTPKSLHKKWGENTGSRQLLNRRNADIRNQFEEGSTIDDLAEQYCLSQESIKKIVYAKS